MSMILKSQLSRKIALCSFTGKLDLRKTVGIRHKATRPTSKSERVVVTDDGSTVVCWHPEKEFPYECSRAIPEEIVCESNSVLKVQNLSAVYDVFKPKTEDQVREELMKLTVTTKHRWYPRGKKTYLKKPIPRDRDYL